MTRILRAAGAAGLALALLAPAAAHGDRWSSADEAGDVEGWSYHPDPEPCGTVTELDGTADTNTDITRLIVRHTRRGIVVTTRYRDLDPDLEQVVFVNFRSSTGGYALDFDRWQRRDGSWRTLTFLSTEPEFPDPDDIPECEGFGVVSFGIPCRIEREANFERNFIRLAVPRKCLHNPRWVRVGVSAYKWVEPADPDDLSSTTFHDDWDGGVELSPWLPPFGLRVRATRGAQVGESPTVRATTGERRHVVRRDGLITRR